LFTTTNAISVRTRKALKRRHTKTIAISFIFSALSLAPYLGYQPENGVP
jgi:hypothetical protein